MKLIHADTKVEVKIGETLISFRGTEAVLERIERPKSPNSTGRVYVKGNNFGSYPSVYGLEWTDREDQA